MINITLRRQFLATFILVCFALVGQSITVSAKSPNIDFKLLYRAAKMSNVAYSSKTKILADLKGRSARVATPGNAEVQYFTGYNDRKKLQGISVRGTANDRNWDLDKDKTVVRDKKTGILMHRGFQTAAQAIYKDSDHV